jgi:hypothetical protein
MFVIEFRSVGTYPTNEATVSLDYVRHESLEAKNYNLPIGAFD